VRQNSTFPFFLSLYFPAQHIHRRQTKV